MKRRQFIKAAMISSSVFIGVGGSGFLLIDEVNEEELTIDVALKKLDALSNASLVSFGEWNAFQIFTHCAQSVEYSMSQFPVHKSIIFKETIGKLAFSIFSSKGKMTHSLSEQIPGAPLVISNMDVAIALNRLKTALIDFKEYQGTIAQHFAYGKLTKQEFEIAHVIHLYNHLQEIKS
jgi:hypothetical protein